MTKEARISNSEAPNAKAFVLPASFVIRISSFVIILLLLGCSSTKQNQPGPTATLPAPKKVWPEPPADPRIAYVQSISVPADLGMKISAWSRFGGWLTGKSKAAEKFDKPFGVAVDEAGNLCVTDTSEAVVWFFDRNRHRFCRWEKIDRLHFVAPVAVAKKLTMIFVADSGLGQVLAFNEEGRLLFAIKEGLSRPVGLAIVDDKLFVAESQLHCVAVFDLRGKPLFKFGQSGSRPGEFNFPTHVAAGRPGEVLVTDSMNSRLQVFNLEGRLVRVIGEAGDTSGHFSRPKGSATDTGGRIYVVDALFDNLQIFDTEGRFLLDFGQAGSGVGEFWLPNGIAITRLNEIFVADSYNHRIEVFKYVGPE
jgi:DNA-binding beta-propeller fold protein YncE